MLAELFTVELTAAVGTCGGCGATDAVGALHLYRAAGIVLRCPRCDGVLMRLVESPDRVWIDLTGLRSLEVRRER